MKEYGKLPVTPEVHRRAKILSARLGIRIMDVVERALDLLEAQNELPHPTDGAGVPVIYTEKGSTGNDYH